MERVREIPGFYYDPEKKKYFKIQANHLVPTGSQYSQQEVTKRRKLSSKHKRTTAQEHRRATETISRSRVLNHPALGAFALPRECGYAPTGKTGICRSRGELLTASFRKQNLVDLEKEGRAFPVSRFVRDPRSGNLIVAINSSRGYSLSAYQPDDIEKPWRYSEPNEDALLAVGHSHWVTSFAISHNGHLLTTSCSQDGGTVHFTISHLLDSIERDRITGDVTTTFSSLGSMSWSSAACPSNSSKSTFAVGNSTDLVSLSNSGMEWHFNVLDTFHHTDIRAVEWLDENVIMAGLNNSLIMLHDVRAGKSISRLSHPYGAHSIRKIDQSRVIAAGPKSNLHMYDLRYAPRPSVRFPGQKKKSYTWSKPYLSFRDYNNDLPTHDDVDVCPQLDLLACGSETNKIQLFSLTTGKLVHPPPTVSTSSVYSCQSFSGTSRPTPESNAPITSYQYPVRIENVRFEASLPGMEETYTANGGPSVVASLLVGSGCVVDEWRM